ncbi:TPA: amidohydrolase [Methanosarcina acetivorans]|uniref:Amidohydrolase 3 domain-containing protein n=2 Tax=Methanosarcina acetivorans TaxID=2214 RepID=Q8TLS5_METAC|nr:amidohydrolase [Methanosarcina acetivorans]AAM06327.1 conserved hypothetical protein [Methanosarcina acetivorans C2A]HIH95415.1 amidohydrolase [Methanosarcina acetivorans]
MENTVDAKKDSTIAFTGGRILTMDSEQKYAEAVVIRGDRIAAVGGTYILKSFPDAEIRDLKNRYLLPAFIDSHNHLSSFGCFFPTWANLIGLTEKEAILKAIRRQVRKEPGTGWIVGFGWFDARMGGADLTKKDLDEVSSDRPVLLIQTTFHQSVVNTRALGLLGINQSTPDPRCGIIFRESDGTPTGVLVEYAQAPVFKLVMEADTETLADLIEARAKELLQFGITAIHDPGATPAAEAAYRQLHAEGRLPVSVLMMPHGETLLDNRLRDRLQGQVTGTGDERLRVGPIKLFADGATAETVAFSLKIGGQTINSGCYRDDFEEMLFAATEKGFRVCVHSFGNATTDAVLTAFENAALRAPAGFEMRPRLEHVTLINALQIRRLASMGGCACIQPQFLSRAQNTKQVMLEDGKWYAYGDLVKGGVIVASSSDDPGGFMDARDPIKGSVMGSTMSDGEGNVIFPDQVLPFEQWLWMYTAGGAYAGGQEKERGILKKGMVADLVILEGSLDSKNPTVVAETWAAGKQVYTKE